jgi:hypothetical protein
MPVTQKAPQAETPMPPLGDGFTQALRKEIAEQVEKAVQRKLDELVRRLTA